MVYEVMETVVLIRWLEVEANNKEDAKRYAKDQVGRDTGETKEASREYKVIGSYPPIDY